MKKGIKLRNFEYSLVLEQAIYEFVEHYSKHRHREALDNLTPEVVYYRREEIVKEQREKIKEATLRHRRIVDPGSSRLMAAELQ